MTVRNLYKRSRFLSSTSSESGDSVYNIRPVSLNSDKHLSHTRPRISLSPNLASKDPVWCEDDNINAVHSLEPDYRIHSAAPIDVTTATAEEEDVWSFDKAVAEVNSILDPRPLSSSLPRRPVSGVEKLLHLQPKTTSPSLLPHSPVVSDTLSILQEESAGLEAKDWSISATTLKTAIPSKPYQVHSPAFPLKPRT